MLLRVEVPNALPLILGGLRTATLQIVATATVAAYASLGGLGRYLIDGIKVRQFYLALVGALMVTALALILDAALAFAVWLSEPGSRPVQADAAAVPRRRGRARSSASTSRSDGHFRRRLRSTGAVAYGGGMSEVVRSDRGKAGRRS